MYPPFNIGVEVDAIRAVFPQTRIELVSGGPFNEVNIRATITHGGRNVGCQFRATYRVGSQVVESLARMLAESVYP